MPARGRTSASRPAQGRRLRRVGARRVPGRRERLWRRRQARRVLSALLAAAACALVVTAFAPPQVDETVPVLVAARDLVGGALVVEGDVAVARWPAQVAPPGRLTEPGQALGRALTTSVGAGEALTPTRLLKSGTGPPGGADRVVTAVAGVDRATLGVLRAGDRVDLLAPATGATLADAALVVADPVVASGDDLGPDGAAGSVLLALRPAEAVALARARADLDLPLVVVVRARPG